MLACRCRYAADYRAKRHRSRTAGPPQPGHDPAHRARRERDDGRRGARARAAVRPVDGAMARHDRRRRAASHRRAGHPLRAGALAFPAARAHRRAGDRGGDRRDRPGLVRPDGPNLSRIAAGLGAAPDARPFRVRRAARLFRAAHQGAFAGHRRIQAAGAAGAHPPAFPVQQHQCGAVPRAFRPQAGGNRAPRHGRPVPRPDARQPRARAPRRRDRALPAVPRAREAAACPTGCRWSGT